MDRKGLIQLRILPNAGMEGTAKFVYEHVNNIVKRITEGRGWVTKVECRENEKNSAIYIP